MTTIASWITVLLTALALSPAVMILDHLHARAAARRERLAHDADLQHWFVMDGDDLGVYGDLRTVQNMNMIAAWKGRE